MILCRLVATAPRAIEHETHEGGGRHCDEYDAEDRAKQTLEADIVEGAERPQQCEAGKNQYP